MNLQQPVFATDTIDSVFIETESFDDHGGWKLDTQFIQQMGSPYLLAHGLGTPVADAVTAADIPETGRYRVWVRTMDWVARWNAKPSPGQFQVVVNGKPLRKTFGTESVDWAWQDGGIAELESGRTEIRLRDLTGFDGRCDAIFLTRDLQFTPPPIDQVLSPWRRKQLGLSEQPRVRDGYDLVVVGGGYSGMGAALSAARMGCRVALIQDRGVLGGNGSSEVRVWAMGNIRRGKFPRIGEIIEEFCDHATKSPGRYEEFGDEQKEQIVRAEKNIDLMLHHHAYAVQMSSGNLDSDGRIDSVSVLNTRTGEDLRVAGKFFVDCTGHGWVGKWAGADLEMTPAGRMGMSNMWRWDNAKQAKPFPASRHVEAMSWTLDLNMADFPYPRDFHGQWFWESGFDRDPIGEAEAIRDWNLRAVYGAFNAMKNRDGAADHPNAELTWVAYVGGPRESRRLLGDVVLTQDDVVSKRDFPDGCVPSTWSIDLHYPKKQYSKKYPENPFISVAVHDRRVDRSYGYPVPYRCFYSRNIENLFMAGRCVSVTHEALGTVRVMKTCGMMGEVVGKAASICTANQCTPREVYDRYLEELLTLLKLPGKARRDNIHAAITIPDDALPLAPEHGPPPGLVPSQLPGIVMDDRDAELKGPWKVGTGLKPFVGYEYRYAAAGSKATATFTTTIKEGGTFRLRLYNGSHKNRGTNVPVRIEVAGKRTETFRVDQRAEHRDSIIELGPWKIPPDTKMTVTIGTDGARGTVHCDAISWVSTE
ncbi:MAG: FAD-dependent oxidoreductase [Planctomycetota bacterium]